MTKQYILDEIKRTSEKNAGVPLGHRKFFLDTGIRVADWQKIWVRWGDAVREAGYAPNQKKERFPDDLLITKFIALTRELGHLAGFQELRMKGRHDKDFPNDRVFARFGSKGALLSKIADYCRTHEGFGDVLSFLNDPVPLDSPTESVPEVEEFGFVYLFKCGRRYKIGHSNSTGRRGYELNRQSPDKVVLVHELRTDDPEGIEAYWHRRFATKRKHGEWFELHPKDITAFKRRKSFM